MNTIWRIELFGGLVAQRCDDIRREPVIVRRFRTHKTGALMALLAFSRRDIAREVVIDELWPEATLATGRNNLRIALSSLRRQLELPDMVPGSIVRADRMAVGFDPRAVITDVEEFEAHLQAAHSAGSTDHEARTQRRQHLSAACDLFRSPLLPGYYENWIASQAQSIEGQYFSALIALVDLLQREGELEIARDWVWRGLAVDPQHRELRNREAKLFEPVADVPAPKPKATRKPKHAKPIKDAEEKASAEKASFVRVHLPPVWNRFFAREREIALLTAWLYGETRLVTLHGVGGSGKTRLAIEVARHIAASQRDTAPPEAEHGDNEIAGMAATPIKVLWKTIAFVALAAITSADLISVAIADVLQLPHAGELPPLERVVHALANSPTLLVLDNFEQLMDGATVVQTLLERLPLLRILVTSRHRLGLPGEREWALAALPVPSLNDTADETGDVTPFRPTATGQTATETVTSERHREASEWPSVRLFVDRARAVRADFSITRRNARDVITLMRKLEGLPLAIELAAARAAVLSPAAMLSQLENPLDFLQTRRIVEPRHAGLRVCIEWSYRLLPPQLQELWTCLSVLRGGWSLEAASALCCGGEDDAARQSVVLEQLEALRDASFIVFDDRADTLQIGGDASASQAWFQILEVLQAFADEKLTAQRRSLLHTRHAVYFAGLAESMETHFIQTGQWPGAPDADQDNFRAVFERALESGSAQQLDAALRTAGALWWFWPARGHIVEARDYLSRLLKAARTLEASNPGSLLAAIVAKAELCAGLMAYHGGQGREAHALFESALSDYRMLGDAAGMAASHNYLGTAALSRMDIEAAREHYLASLSVRREWGDVRQSAVALSCLAEVAVAANRGDEALQYISEAQSLWRGLNDRGGLGWLLSLQGILAENKGDVVAARAFFEQSLELRQLTRLPVGIATALFDMGRIEDAQEHYGQAYEFYQRSLAMRHRLGHHRALLDVLEAIAGVFPFADQSTLKGAASAHTNDTDNRLERARRAARVLGATQAWRDSLSMARPHHIARLRQQAEVRLQNILDAEFSTHYTVGLSLTIDDAIRSLT